MRIVSHLSGGFDSAASSIKVAKLGFPFYTLMIDLGQSYLKQEISAAHYLVEYLKNKYPNYLGHKTLKVEMALSQEGQVGAYIPVRNLVIGSMSANYALAVGATHIAVGNKTLELRPNDPYCFNDCSREFYNQLGSLCTFASQGSTIEFLMPLVENGVPISKRDLILFLDEQGIDVTKLWSCYETAERPCGVCYHCKEIKAAGVWDLVTGEAS